MNLETLLAELSDATGILRTVRERAMAHPQRLLLPESGDPRILVAAAAMVQTGLASPLLLGSRPPAGLAAELAERLGPEHWWDNSLGSRRRDLAEQIWRHRRHRGLTQGQAYVLAAEPLYQAMGLLSQDRADGVVAGASVATAEVARAALWLVGTAPPAKTVSGAFLLIAPDGSRRPLLLADCAVVPRPDQGQLVEITEATALTYRRLLGCWPAIALLSFSTRGSSQHAEAARVAAAAAEVASSHPRWRVVGEVQVDAALMPQVARAKGIDWGDSGAADVLVFPDLASGNIGSKLVERLGGWRAIGPLLQGLRRPVCDLSRGCSALDVVDAAALVGACVEPASG